MFPPTEATPLVIATADGRLIGCAVRCLRRNRAEPRWVFTTELHDLGGAMSAMTFIGPVYRREEHDTPEAVHALASAWWNRQREVERPRLALARRLAGPVV